MSTKVLMDGQLTIIQVSIKTIDGHSPADVFSMYTWIETSSDKWDVVFYISIIFLYHATKIIWQTQ